MEKSFITRKFTLLPSAEAEELTDTMAQKILSEIYEIPAVEKVMTLPVMKNSALLIYSVPAKLCNLSGGDKAIPLIYNLIENLQYINDHNKLIINISKETPAGNNSILHIALQEGPKFILANTFDITDLNTAIYYILLSLKSVQLNPNQTRIFLLNTELTDNECSLMRKYFKGIENI